MKIDDDEIKDTMGLLYSLKAGQELLKRFHEEQNKKTYTWSEVWEIIGNMSDAMDKEMRGMVKVEDVLKIIDKEFPLCICDDGIEGGKADCPNELMDGAWTDGINRDLTKKIKALAEVKK